MTTPTLHPGPQDHATLTRARREEHTRERLLAAQECADPERRKAILDEVVLLNLPVAEAIARRYANRGIALEDLQQAAYEGLVKAVTKFDPTVRPDLLTYAVPTIRGEVQRWFRDHGWAIRPPRRIQELQWQTSRSVETLSVELGREPTDQEISTHAGCTVEELREAREGYGCFTTMSLDRESTGEGSGTVGDLLADVRDDGTAAVEARVVLQPAISTLGERDRRILYLRFFEEKSQLQIGEELGITQMQVSRLLGKILRRVRRELGTDAPAGMPAA